MHDRLLALRILYCAGWVHRDISKGNFLVVEDGSGKWKLKLADFELSKQSGHGNGRIVGSGRTNTVHVLTTLSTLS